ncbi:hypothetical protein C0992_009121 [Termitomyces sp. T32_za158]|nr:hypothetical protein C0992_009121 [Termitomyces sp. T32_za158]
MQELPPDTWASIAGYLPPEDLPDLISVNRALFNLVLDKRYGVVEWGTLDKKLYQLLERLQDPSIAGRVRRLHIRPWFIQYLLEREALFQRSSVMERQTWSYTFGQIMNYFYPNELNATSDGRPPPRPRGFTTYPPTNQLMSFMIKALKGMTNVTECEFQWRDMPVNAETLSFLSSARAAFHPNLSKLVLRSRVSRFGQILTFADFRQLTELELHFEYDPSTERDIGMINVDVLIQSVAPFINQLQDTLHTLTVASVARCDHSAFLRALGPLPYLRTLTLQMQFNDAQYLYSPSSLSNILLRHKTSLTTLVIRPSYEEGPAKALTAWQAIGDACTADLSGLDSLKSLTFPALDLSTMMSLIHHAPAPLNTLCLFGRYLMLDEIASVIGALGSLANLRTLSLDVQTLSSDMFSLLANALPALRSLTIVLETPPVRCVTYTILGKDTDALVRNRTHIIRIFLSKKAMFAKKIGSYDYGIPVTATLGYQVHRQSLRDLDISGTTKRDSYSSSRSPTISIHIIFLPVSAFQLPVAA